MDLTPFLDSVATVITKSKHMNSPLIREMRKNGAEVWSDQHIRASYEGLKKLRPNNKFKDMRSVFGKHKGETVFVCGAGPSLAGAPSKLPGPTFAINRAIAKVEAQYWCFSDVLPTKLYGDHPNAKAADWAFSSCMHVFFKDVPGYLIEANDNPIGHHVEAQRPLYFNGATFSWALHWAIKSGAKRIILVGCEFSIGPYFDGSPMLPTNTMNAQMIAEVARIRVDDMFGPDKEQWFDPSVEILDASNGYLPLPKTKLEEWL